MKELVDGKRDYYLFHMVRACDDALSFAVIFFYLLIVLANHAHPCGRSVISHTIDPPTHPPLIPPPKHAHHQNRTGPSTTRTRSGTTKSSAGGTSTTAATQAPTLYRRHLKASSHAAWSRRRWCGPRPRKRRRGKRKRRGKRQRSSFIFVDTLRGDGGKWE